MKLWIMLISVWVIYGWYEVLGWGLGLGFLYVNDGKVSNYLKSVRDEGYNNLLSFDYAGNGVYVGSVLISGYIIGNKKFKNVTINAIKAFLYSGVIVNVIKYCAGRTRPYEDPYKFKPFSGNDSFPSGHASTAFSVLTVYAIGYGKPYSYLLYSLAGLTAFARVYNGAHWATDVIVGSVIGYKVANFLNKKNSNYTYFAPNYIVIKF
ncbi:MAG: phosphatase PAP2 family protein [bacterium]|nr:phosphatase PAP2 family protein [bacterium]